MSFKPVEESKEIVNSNKAGNFDALAKMSASQRQPKSKSKSPLTKMESSDDADFFQ